MSFDAALRDVKDRVSLGSQGFASLHPGLLSASPSVVKKQVLRFVQEGASCGVRCFPTSQKRDMGHPFSC
jgi:hypothetical protein